MRAIAVGAFEDHEIGGAEHARVAHDGGAAVAEVTREHQPAAPALFLELEFDDGRAEDMPGIVQAQAHARHDGMGFVVIQTHEALHGALGLATRVQGQARRQAFAFALAVLPFDFLLVDEGGVAQQDLA